MPKSQKELFEIEAEDNEVVEKPKKKKTKKPMTDEAKAILIERLKAGKERKRLEREGLVKPKPAQNKADDVMPVTPKPISNNTIDNRDLEIKELKEQIKETKNKLEMQSLKDELKELRKLIKEEKKQENLKVELNTIPEEQKPLLPVSTPAPPPAKPQPPPPPKRLKKRIR